MGYTRFPVLVFLTLEAVLLLVGSGLAMYDPNLFLQQLHIPFTSKAVTVLVMRLLNVVGVTMMTAAVLLFGLVNANDSSAAEFTFSVIWPVDLAFTYLVYEWSQAALEKGDVPTIIFFGFNVLFVATRLYFTITGVSIPPAPLQPRLPRPVQASSAPLTAVASAPRTAPVASAEEARVSPPSSPIAKSVAKTPRSVRVRKTRFEA